MAARIARTAVLALAIGMAFAPAALAIPEEPIDYSFQSLLDWLGDVFGGDEGGYDHVDNEVLEWDGDGGGSGDEDEEPRVEAR
jgi:hypothetical protein